MNMPNHDTYQSAQDGDGSIISGHSYDGIEEYDNPMPGWWVWMFVASIIWTPIYMLCVHQFDFINDYQDDLALKQADLADMRSSFEEANPKETVTDESIAAYVGVAEHQAAGAEIYSTNCAMCHGNAGEGLIGPNLTDAYWIHGNSNADVFNVITNGVLEKGMTPWESVLSVEERSQLVSYIHSLLGSNPAGAKAPEGDLIERS